MISHELIGIALAALAVVISYWVGRAAGHALGHEEGYQAGKRDGSKQGAMRGYAVGYDRGRRSGDPQDEEEGEASSGPWRALGIKLAIAVIVGCVAISCLRSPPGDAQRANLSDSADPAAPAGSQANRIGWESEFAREPIRTVPLQ